VSSMAGKFALLEELLGRPESTCESCGQQISGTAAFITPEQALGILNSSEPPIDVDVEPT
jgi:hypothetical protein